MCFVFFPQYFVLATEFHLFISAVKHLIAINRIQNKSFCLHNICVLFIYYVYINTHTYSIYFENIYMYIHLFTYIIYIFFFLKYIHACVCVIYIFNIWVVCFIYLLCKQKLLFWMWIIVWQHKSKWSYGLFEALIYRCHNKPTPFWNLYHWLIDWLHMFTRSNSFECMHTHPVSHRAKTATLVQPVDLAGVIVNAHPHPWKASQESNTQVICFIYIPPIGRILQRQGTKIFCGRVWSTSGTTQDSASTNASLLSYTHTHVLEEKLTVYENNALQ